MNKYMPDHGPPTRVAEQPIPKSLICDRCKKPFLPEKHYQPTKSSCYIGTRALKHLIVTEHLCSDCRAKQPYWRFNVPEKMMVR
jgi:hypothetical protein